jgi:hypothetical protein
MQEDNSLWPQPDRVGRLELKIVVDEEHCHVQHRRLVLSRCESNARPRGCAAILLVQDLKCSIFSLIGLQLQIIYIKTMNSCEIKVDMGNGVSVVNSTDVYFDIW